MGVGTIDEASGNPSDSAEASDPVASEFESLDDPDAKLAFIRARWHLLSESAITRIMQLLDEAQAARAARKKPDPLADSDPRPAGEQPGG